MAAPVNKAKFTQDINAPIKAVYGGGLMFSKDNLSNVISVDIVDGGQPFDVTGTVSGTVIRSDGTTVPVDTGAISGNTVSLTLTEACFDVPGQIVANIIVTNGDVKCCVLRAVYTVVPTETSSIVDPGDILPSIADLIDDIDAAVASIPADYSGLLASIAGTFSPSTAYAAGSYVWYDGTLYRFTAAHAAGSWTGSDATEVTIGGELADINSAIDPMMDTEEMLTNKLPTGGNNTAITYNNDGSTTIGTTDNGNTLFGSMLTLAPGDYYLFGVPQGIAFLSPNATGSGSYNNRVFENTSSGPKKYHTDVSINLAVGFRSPSRPSEAYTIYPSLFQLVPKVDRALLEMNALADGTDLNTIVEPGIYLLNSTATYVHAPDIASGIMIVTRAGSVVNQTVNQFGINARTYTPNLGVRNGTVSGVTSDWKYIGRKYGLRAAMIGDSITWGRNGDISDPNASGFRTEYQIPDVLAHNLGIACDNMGVGSMGWVKTGDGDVKAYDVLSALTLSDYDAIFFCLGVNDGFSPLGTWNSEDETTIMGQFNKCIKYIMTNRPRIRVIVVAPFNGRNIGTFPDYWYGPRDNPQGYVSRRVLSDTLKQACQYYWIPYIEQYDGPINPYSIDTLIGTDGVHPTNTGYIALGQWLSSKIGAVL